MVVRMAIASTTSLVDFLRQYRLLEAEQLAQLPSLLANFPEPKALAGELIRRGWLTAYQADLLLQGRGRELLLGSYVLLEKLGEGGMGAVFKARNWKLGRVVALKLMRKERLDNADAVHRFQREVRAVAALSHPNIVHALDADQVGGTHLLVMEHVLGSDLARRVKENGPLPVARACDLIRQAALGLQHAHEKGFVHRDIKPSNLLLTADGTTIKILDLGLARLVLPSSDEEATSTMTQEGTMVGTPDYIAPEQALESHKADIRADLYSLGCTLYHLLAGQVPFPGGTLIHKINRHQFHEPAAIEGLRPDVPPDVAAVVRKLMAKRPEERFQTPAEVAAALAALPLAGSEDDRTLAVGVPATAQAEPSADTVGSPFASLLTDTVQAKSAPPRRRLKEESWFLLLVAAASLVLVGAVVLMVRWWPETELTAPPASKPTPEQAKADGGRRSEEAWRRELAALPAQRQVDAVTVRLKELNPGFDGKVTHKVEGGVVTEFALLTDRVTDLSPLRAFPALRTLHCTGSIPGAGRLSDLSPLRGMMLTELYCYRTQVSDLSPLKDMRLGKLICNNTQVCDLSPLKDMQLTELNCHNTRVAELSPLKEMKLTHLYCDSTPVADLTPLKDMKLTEMNCSVTPVSDLTPLKNMKLIRLWCVRTQVSDLTPLRGMPLKVLGCDFQAKRDTALLRSLASLEEINDKPAKQFWKEVDASKP
jgi:serine/threonine protein kinase